jgi:hypothetical protein
LFTDQVLRKSLVTVTEDLSKRTRESRQELRKFMRQVSRCARKSLVALTEDLSKRTKVSRRAHMRGEQLGVEEITSHCHCGALQENEIE